MQGSRFRINQELRSSEWRLSAHPPNTSHGLPQSAHNDCRGCLLPVHFRQSTSRVQGGNGWSVVPFWHPLGPGRTSRYGNGYWLMTQKQNSSNLPLASWCKRSTIWSCPPLKSL